MNLLAIIVVFLAVVICVAIAYIAWELSSDEPPPPRAGPRGDDPGNG
jgi:flagellar basal body-associated protein FliL